MPAKFVDQEELDEQYTKAFKLPETPADCPAFREQEKAWKEERKKAKDQEEEEKHKKKQKNASNNAQKRARKKAIKVAKREAKEEAQEETHTPDKLQELRDVTSLQ